MFFTDTIFVYNEPQDISRYQSERSCHIVTYTIQFSQLKAGVRNTIGSLNLHGRDSEKYNYKRLFNIQSYIITTFDTSCHLLTARIVMLRRLRKEKVNRIVWLPVQLTGPAGMRSRDRSDKTQQSRRICYQCPWTMSHSRQVCTRPHYLPPATRPLSKLQCLVCCQFHLKQSQIIKIISYRLLLIFWWNKNKLFLKHE